MATAQSVMLQARSPVARSAGEGRKVRAECPLPMTSASTTPDAGDEGASSLHEVIAYRVAEEASAASITRRRFGRCLLRAVGARSLPYT